ncbi:amidase [Auriculariales sp. MPI-PUGE-AT-0066]|nr:amidase [Auriculariales sp. MPI-PUGE-AT-0066]
MTAAKPKNHAVELPVDTVPYDALNISLRKQHDRESILSRYEDWRSDPAMRLPAAANEVSGDTSELPLALLSEDERHIVKSDATTLAERLARGELLAVAVLTAFAKAAVVAQDTTNCLTEIFFEEALARAKELDEHFAATGAVVGPLHGVPVSIKDHILMKGQDTSTGYMAWAYKTVAEQDALVVDILRRAGAVLFVKTANPQTLLSLETNNNIYGTTYNPYNRRLSPGGSSGGESSLIACHGSPLGVGTDIGGSIRVPAAWCGLYGLKGSVGRLPHAGLAGSHAGMEAIIGSVGPLARSARDLDLFCRVMSHYTPWRVEHQVLPIPWKNPAEVQLPSRLTFAILWDDGVVYPHPPISDALQKVKTALQCLGHEVIDWVPSENQAAWDLISKLYLLDGGAEYWDTLRAGHEDPVPQTKWILDHAQDRKGYTVAETWRLNVQRDAFRAHVLDHWNATRLRSTSGRVVDAILSPVAPTLAPPHTTVRWWGYSSYWNLCDYPAAVFPVGDRFKAAGFDSHNVNFPPHAPRNPIEAFVSSQWNPKTYDGAPVSLQLIGTRLEEERLLKMLQVVEQALGHQ